MTASARSTCAGWCSRAEGAPLGRGQHALVVLDGLPEAFFETLRGGLHSTRVERFEQALLAVVNDLQFDFAFEPSDTATLWICLNERVFITGRRKPLRSIDQLRMAVREGEPVRSPADLLAQLLRRQAERTVEVELVTAVAADAATQADAATGTATSSPTNPNA